MVDVKKLKGKIVEKGHTITDVATAIKINRATLYRKINENGDNFTIREANDIANYLLLSPDERNTIFFASNVAQLRQ